MNPARSLLFVPGNREEWLKEAHTHGADIVIFDLEDSVPPAEKPRARKLVSQYIPKMSEEDQTVCVRVNGHPNTPSKSTAADIEAVLCEELAAVFLPKVGGATDIRSVETVFNHIESRDSLSGNTEFIVALETAAGLRNAYEVCSASERVSAIVCGAVPGTDLCHEIGFEWTGPGRQGLETLHIRQKALLDAKAAGVDQLFAGTYVDIEDEDGLRDDLHFSREMGYRGYVLIHPSQVEAANEVFTPDPETVKYWAGLKQALAEAIEDGRSAISYRGKMVDTANLSTADTYLRRAKAFEDDIDLDLSALPELPDRSA